MESERNPGKMEKEEDAERKKEEGEKKGSIQIRKPTAFQNHSIGQPDHLSSGGGKLRCTVTMLTS